MNGIHNITDDDGLKLKYRKVMKHM